MKCRRYVEFSAALVLVIIGLLFYQFYLQKIMIVYISDGNYTTVLEQANIQISGKIKKLYAGKTNSATSGSGTATVIQRLFSGKTNPAPSVSSTTTMVKRPPQPVGYEILPLKADIEKMNLRSVASLYERYVIKKQAVCGKMIRLGNIKDGGWDICDDKEFRPNASCLVYSVGINNDFSFDDAISRRYGCVVHAFDPSMKRKDFKRSDKVFFHATGLSNKNGVTKGWKMRTLQNMRQELGHSKSPISVLKVDIEQWETVTIPEMVKSGTMKDIKQFAVEIHVDLGHMTRKQEPRREKYIEVLKSLRDLYDEGFRIVHFHCNPYCIFKHAGKTRCSCHEISFVHIY